MSSPLQFIVFAVEQAQAAQRFGFTRNECCRNLKTALHQHWQNKVMGLHGQSQKHRIPRSKAAVGLSLRDCEVEHAVPQMEIVNWLMELDPVTIAQVEDILTRYFRVLLVTKAEHDRLNASGLRSKMPDDWDRMDVYARYKRVGIEPPDMV